MNINRQSDYLFEVSWEVCNKVGGIYTVVSTKVPSMQKRFGDHYFALGPDVWKDKDNRDFIEDTNLYAEWRKYAESKGIFFRIGRWSLPGQPIAIMADYRSLIQRKDDILAAGWRDYRLDSISGQWDYIEPLLFGYAAGRIIQNFYEYMVFSQEKVYAHFHEWMTGSGLLYLKKYQPQVATVFTTHATVLGRSIAGNGLPLYRDLKKYNPDELAERFGIRAKYSLEKLSAQHADCFTAVSQITNQECEAFLKKPIDVLTPNGFDEHFVPAETDFDARREASRARLREVASRITGQTLGDDTVFLVNSGRYEFKNKGIDLFIDSLSLLNSKEDLQQNVVAFLAVPAGHGQARNSLDRKDSGREFEQTYCTHHLTDPANDPILNRIKLSGLQNRPEDKVKVIFVPCYLDGEDGIFNLGYYDFLIGFDASVFPSYYEPWGYTPLESIAFRIPTLTTSLSGFGRWVMDMSRKPLGVTVVRRDDLNASETVEEITNHILDFCRMDPQSRSQLREEAGRLSKEFLWESLSAYYDKAYGKAAAKWEETPSLLSKRQPVSQTQLSKAAIQEPEWRKILIIYQLPEKLQRLKELSDNLWWCWHTEAQELWKDVDPQGWERCAHNPVALLNSLNTLRLQQLQEDEVFLAKLDKVYRDFQSYMAQGERKTGPKVAYFCMEYGLHESLKIYSGGLGILAGDYLKEASDKNADITGIGLLYRYGYFEQQLDGSGKQKAVYAPQSFSKLPLLPVRDENGQWRTIRISLPGRTLHAKIWRVQIGRVPLYLLDTDIESNSEADRSITHQLYGGDWENRFKQEILLGIGGIRALRQLGIEPDVYHCNEGHGAFTSLERLRAYIEEQGLGFWKAKELVRASSLFTTHTPVPAGHDAFQEDMVRTYFGAWAERLKISWQEFMGLGRISPEHVSDKFSMSHLAVNLSSGVNGVSRIHGQVSREMFAPLYPGYYPQEVPVGYVTNGVHLATWAHPEWQGLFARYFGDSFSGNVSDPGLWQQIRNVPDEEISSIRTRRRHELIDFVKERLQQEWPVRGENPQNLVKALNRLDPDVLTIGFARRFATYKRAHLLFKNIDRLSRIANNPDRPVQFIFAGKAHPADEAGQALIAQIMEISRREDFLGKVVFIENYNIDVAKHLIQGVDVWMNTPTRKMEASGTSGEKALMNGVLNFSVLDGWWAEGYREGAGWALSEEQTYGNTAYQDELDAETIYSMLETEVCPDFYEGRKPGSNPVWIGHIRDSFAMIAPHYTMRRQLDDYYRRYYNNLSSRYRSLAEDGGSALERLGQWVQRVASSWPDIRAVSFHCQDSTNAPLRPGQECTFEANVFMAGLKPEEIGVEVVFGHKVNDKVQELSLVRAMEPTAFKDGVATYSARLVLEGSGVYDYAFRVFPQHEAIDRQASRLLKWL